MARAIWSGAINFGLVSVPVKIFTAVKPKGIAFHQVDEKTGANAPRLSPTRAVSTSVASRTIARSGLCSTARSTASASVR